MTERTDPFSRSVVLRLPAADAVTVRSDLVWGEEQNQLLDLYRPPRTEGQRLPVAVLVTGFRDAGFITTGAASAVISPSTTTC